MIGPAPPTSPAALAEAVPERIDLPSGVRTGRFSESYEHLILGAGCAGLSLAWHLRELGDDRPIALVDRRSSYGNDRTWCYWDVEPTPFDGLATHVWDRWAVVDPSGRWIESAPGSYRYRRLRSIEFYRAVLDRLLSDESVEFFPGESVGSAAVEGDAVAVGASGGPIRGRRAFESARGPDALARSAPRREAAMVQHFLGQTIRADRPAFDPGCPILMDFRVDQSDGPHFVYVLPLSPSEALVENTYLFPAPVSAGRHREEIASYLGRCFGLADYEVTEEESGRIPMTTHRPSAGPDARIVPIGLAGGAARPSSGYAFVRIQRQCRGLAARIARGAPPSPPGPVAGRKYDFFDSVFLRALVDRPGRAPELFVRMFEAVGADPLVRFLCDRSGPIDDARLIAALPKLPFLGAALRSAPCWVPRCLGRDPAD
jgi:lycopene beta-cyclase